MIRIPPTSDHGAATRRYIYADNAATTGIRPKALNGYITACSAAYGNPSSRHLPGRKAQQMLEWSRGVHAKFMNVPPDTVYFTSSGTESNNIVIRGVMSNALRTSGRGVIVTSSVEHSSVRKTAEYACDGKCNHITVPVDGRGYIDESAYRDILQANANHIAMISIILAQNEVGTFQRMPALSRIARDVVGPQVVIHTDATQAFGKYYIDPVALGVDLLTASAHKYHGPKGVGLIYARQGILHPDVLPITGGGQERGCRSGTENVPAISAAAVALESMLDSNDEWSRRVDNVTTMRNLIVHSVLSSIPDTIVNGDIDHGLYNLVSLTLPLVDGGEIAKYMDDVENIAIGSGSACNKGKPSESMMAMGKSKDEALATVRISLSEFNTIDDVELIVGGLVRGWRKFRKMR